MHFLDSYLLFTLLMSFCNVCYNLTLLFSLCKSLPFLEYPTPPNANSYELPKGNSYLLVLHFFFTSYSVYLTFVLTTDAGRVNI